MLVREENTPHLVLVGLGVGGPESLTRQAEDALRAAQIIVTPFPRHPSLTSLPVRAVGESQDVLATVQQILDLTQELATVVYASVGHPLLDSAVASALYTQALQKGLRVQVIAGVGCMDWFLTELEESFPPRASLVAAATLASIHTPPFAPDAPALVGQVTRREQLQQVQQTLLAVYPAQHPIKWATWKEDGTVQVMSVRLSDLDQVEFSGALRMLWVPALDPATSFEAFQEIIARLRAPDGCPWDREQTHQSLRSSMLEETYEVLQALDRMDLENLREELGDVLLNILLQAQIASEAGEFTMTDILRGIHTKIVYRHPHVFGDVSLNDTQGVLQNWERLKQKEKEAAGKTQKGVLDGITAGLPALVESEKIQKRAARVGFDWPKVEGVWSKLEEELQEVKDAPNAEERSKEIGDALFALVNLARWYEVDPEIALRETSLRFRGRFEYIEQNAQAQGRNMSDLTLDEMEALWQAAKHR